jgi:hypothetical protein
VGLGQASLPADEKTIAKRLGYEREKTHELKISSLNVQPMPSRL